MHGSKYSNEHGVSPVVGVMLMLVVTIIIAAVVSAFGGGLMQTDKKAPQASITGEYSQYYGLKMTHMGGDSLDTKDLVVQIRPSEEFGSGQSDFGVRTVNSSYITNGKSDYGFNTSGNTLAYWFNATYGTQGVMSWRPGESMYVYGGPDLQNSGIMKDSTDWPPCYNENVQGGQGTKNGLSMRCFVTSINNQINIGKTVTLEILTKDGKLISSSPMVIEP
jgi:Uncharacterized protein conserved in archaea